MARIKTIGASGQISLGKEYAGQHVLVEETEPGVWVIKLGHFIPESEAWLHEAETKKTLDRAISWAEENPPEETDLDALESKLKE